MKRQYDQIRSEDITTIFLDHFIFMNTDFLMMPNIDDGFNLSKLIVEYEKMMSWLHIV